MSRGIAGRIVWLEAHQALIARVMTSRRLAGEIATAAGLSDREAASLAHVYADTGLPATVAAFFDWLRQSPMWLPAADQVSNQ